MNLVEYLTKSKVPFQLVPHTETFDAQRLAQSVGVSGHQVAKTVLLRADGDYTYVVAVLPADRNIDLRRLSQLLGGARVELATELEVAEHCPDCEIGVLPPFGSQYNLDTIVDEHLAQAEEIVFEGNTHHEAIRMKFADFRRIESPLIGSFAVETLARNP